MENPNADIVVQYAGIEQAMKTIQGCNTKMFEILTRIQSVIVSMTDEWEGIVSDVVELSIKSQTPKMERYREDIEKYAAFLNETIEAYKATEEKLSANAAMFD